MFGIYAISIFNQNKNRPPKTAKVETNHRLFRSTVNRLQEVISGFNLPKIQT